MAEPPVLDGAVLDDPAWAAVPAVSEFWQTQPDERQPASERTEVRVVFTDQALFFGVVCFDREPGRLVVNESRRDSSLDETDSFRIILDTYLDRQNGFVFGTNPAAIEYDGQVTQEGEGGSGYGATAGFNLNWDASWEVRALTGPFGWSAEFSIPFRTLRYARGGSQVWGLNCQRNIRRRNETAFWAPLGRQHGLFRVSSAGTLLGIEVPSQQNLKLTPYALGKGQWDTSGGEGRDAEGDLGLDAKYSLTPSLTLDVTVNTDFAQVEIDEQQVSLNRFDLFFPEKRPFFLENAGQFSVGTPEEAEMFFSRRIGIGPGGEPVPILAGIRVSGRTLGTNVGLLNIQTRAANGMTPANNFTVARLTRDLPNRSGVGVIFVGRHANGELAGPRDHNRGVGLDARWGVGRYGQLSGYAMRTFTPEVGQPEHAVRLAASYESPRWDLSAGYTDVGEGFNPELGFLARTGYRKPELLVLRTIRPAGLLSLLEIRPHVSYRGYWKPDGFQESGFLHLDNHLEWRSGYELHTGVNFTREGLREPFEIFPGVTVPPGRYDHTEVRLVGMTNQASALRLSTEATIGGLFGGDRISIEGSVGARVGETFQAEVGWDRHDVDLPGGAFVTNLARARISYSFNPRVFLQALLQYNDTIDNWSTNVRFGWLQTANTGFFLVYSENLDTVDGGFGLRDRSLVVKFSRLFDLLD